MHIVCPHCTTSYGINPATLGESGRTVRCARCKEVWLARPDAVESAAALPVLAKASHARQRDIAAEWGATTETEEQSPVVESPSIAADRSDGQASSEQGNAGWIALVSDAAMDEDIESRGAWFGSLPNAKWPERGRAGGLAFGSLTTACAAMTGLVVALLVWRTEVVRLWKMVLEQTTPKSGEQLLFKLRLASRPVEGKGIYVRFFNKRDIAGGSV